ncbi:MAG: pyridoxal phosphate-dependent aminotransferase [Nitrospirota bacterium]|nr:pyridoxal phosphate-dependent aminotransferase [Nitrospirota bacterium]MDE3118375.1 pyridoxal phosphate-dependent aminotransferase [Nitrospirota bacterium]MDE3241275.1 pyridoxal phosphate-dependent aminotransferase [Nitrospirota bacterium]
MKLAARAGRIVPSPTLSITATAKAMAAQGLDVIDFASGEPDFDTPEPVKAAAEAAIRAGFTKYTASSGIDELKSAIVDKFQAEQGLRYEKSQILVSCGAKHTLYNLAQALFDVGDEVLIPSPFWVSYRDQVLLNDATPVLVQTNEADGYAVSRALLEAHLTPKSKAIIVNSPSNPTGATYDRSTLEDIADMALRRDLVIISDEIYEKILYDGATHISIATLSPEIAARTVVVNGVSKAYAMTGWRIGYAAGPKKLITAMADIQSQSTSNPTSISQKAAVAALRGGDAFPRQMVVEFDRRRRLMVERLNKMPGVSCRMPAGAFYAFPNVAGLFQRRHGQTPIDTPAALAAYLLKEAQIAVVPGEPFGSTSHIRLSYATSTDAIARGMDRMEAALHKLTS